MSDFLGERSWQNQTGHSPKHIELVLKDCGVQQSKMSRKLKRPKGIEGLIDRELEKHSKHWNKEPRKTVDCIAESWPENVGVRTLRGEERCSVEGDSSRKMVHFEVRDTKTDKDFIDVPVTVCKDETDVHSNQGTVSKAQSL